MSNTARWRQELGGWAVPEAVLEAAPPASLRLLAGDVRAPPPSAVAPASRVVGVDRQLDMLRLFESTAVERGVEVSTVPGSWPEVAGCRRLCPPPEREPEVARLLTGWAPDCGRASHRPAAGSGSTSWGVLSAAGDRRDA